MARHKAPSTALSQALTTEAILSADISLPEALSGRHTATPSYEAIHAETEAYYLASLDWEE